MQCLTHQVQQAGLTPPSLAPPHLPCFLNPPPTDAYTSTDSIYLSPMTCSMLGGLCKPLSIGCWSLA